MKQFNKLQLILLISAISFAGVLIYFSYLNVNNSKIVYVNAAKVFEGFKMSKELKLEAERQLSAQKVLVDSLYGIAAQSGGNELAMQNFLGEKQKLDAFADAFSTQQSQKIWKRIESYAGEFLNDHGYDMVLGAQPNFNIVAGSKNADVTNDFIAYINKKYEGN